MQFNRQAIAIIGATAATTALKIEGLRIAFEIEKSSSPQPQKMLLRIYNMSVRKYSQPKYEFDGVRLDAGYAGDIRTIFNGTIKSVTHYHEGPNSVTEVSAGDGDALFLNAIVNIPMSSGATARDIIDKLPLKISGITQGDTINVDSKKRLRGSVVSGTVRSVLDTIAKDAVARWFIQDGFLYIVGKDDFIPSPVTEVNSQTGMLTTPVVTETGIVAKTLLNPGLIVGGRIKLDNDVIRQKTIAERRSKGAVDPDDESDEPTVDTRTSSDGIYTIHKIEHRGDTHGADWYSEVTVLAN